MKNHHWNLIPAYMHDAYENYFEYGIEPGSFVMAVLCNDLKQAAACADDTNKRLLFEHVQFLYIEAPAPCWGSPEKVAKWMKEKRG